MKKENKKESTKSFCIYVEADLKKKVQMKCLQHDMSMTSYIVQLITDDLESSNSK